MPVPVRQAPSGTWLVAEPASADREALGRVVAYCRVPSGDQKADLEWQAARVVACSNGLGPTVAEVGSGLNGRRKLHRGLFGTEHLEAVLSASGRRLVVFDPTETTDGLVWAITEVLTSMCVRLYGQGAAKNRVARAVAVAAGEAAA